MALYTYAYKRGVHGMVKLLDAVMQKEMSRKEFLVIAGMSIASIFGFSNVIRLVTGKTLEQHVKGTSSSSYNGNDYNG